MFPIDSLWLISYSTYMYIDHNDVSITNFMNIWRVILMTLN